MSTLQPDNLIGTRLNGRYEVVSEIGHGRSGVVYKSIDSTLNRPVALKVMYEDMGDDKAYQRFKREAMAAGALNHPNIITVFDFGQTLNNYAFLILEFLNGRDLHTILNEEGHLPLGRAVRIASQICLALGHAHKRGVVHRDLKPSNIMLRDLEEMEDFVKIVDFGIAKRFDVEEETIERLTMEGQLLGTPAYMSPEQCQSTKPLDARSDIYSLGCVIFRMLTGTTPIKGESLLDVINGHLNRMPLTFAEVSGSEVQVPEEVQKIVLRALAKRPEDRQQSMFELRLQLNAAYAATVEGAPRTYAVSGKTTGGQPAPPSDVSAQYELALKLESGDGVAVDKAESRKWLTLAAERGHRDAQHKLGVDLLDGENANPAEGIKWLRRAAEQGHEKAQFKLAQCYETGKGVGTVDLPQAISWYEEAARQGNKQAETQLSICYERCYASGQDSEGMEAWLRGRTQSGDPVALLALANYLRRRVDADQHQAEIFQLILEAAQKGDMDSQLLLGKQLLHGGRPQDYPQAFQWLSSASQYNNPDALLLKGVCHKNGFGTPPDPAAALACLERAADSGHPDAQALLGCSLMLGDSIPRNLTRGITLLKNAAAARSSFAQWKLALCCKNGLGTTRDPRETERWLASSAEGRFNQGLPWSWTQPGLRFEEVVQFSQTLASVDNRQAYYWLGICYEEGLSLPRDQARAVEFYSKAAQRGHAQASEALARLRGPARV
jgi:serine/threonine-protein kinase